VAIPLRYSWKNVLARPLNTALTALAVALWAFLFIFFSGFLDGLRFALTATGSPSNAIVIRPQSTSETNSSVTRDQASVLATLPQVARDASGQPALAGEAIVLINLPRLGSSTGANVTIRGVTARSLDPGLGRRIRLLPGGRMFRSGAGELLVSRNISRRYQNCEVGSTLHFEHRDWHVVGVFDAGGTAFDSEIWGDRDEVLAQFKREAFSSVTFRMADPAGFPALRKAIADDQRLQLEAHTERQYYDDQRRGADWMKYIFYALTLIFSVSMFFAAANAIYAAVQARTREIGTLRAIGFSGADVLRAFLAESMALGLIGGLVGAVPASLLVSRLYSGTTNFSGGGFSDLTFQFRVTPQLFGVTLLLCCLICVVGGLVPSARASRIGITTALREL
jgi:putative ABC transport system permease protein